MVLLNLSGMDSISKLPLLSLSLPAAGDHTCSTLAGVRRLFPHPGAATVAVGVPISTATHSQLKAPTRLLSSRAQPTRRVCVCVSLSC